MTSPLHQDDIEAAYLGGRGGPPGSGGVPGDFQAVEDTYR